MQQYVVPFLVYLFSLFLPDTTLFHALRFLTVSALLVYYRKHYSFTLKPDLFAIAAGILIAVIWVGLEGFYPLLGDIGYVPLSYSDFLFKLAAFIILAPIVEEYFVRNFLARYLINDKWEKVKLGTYTTFSFAVSALFFGFSHNRWLVGILAGVILNYVMLKRKNMGSAIQAHAAANIALAAYIVLTGSWQFW